MKITRRRINKAVCTLALFCMATQSTFAALLNLTQVPLFLGANVPPKVMLAITKDQQLFKKAYNDYSDLDNDKVPDITYKNTIPYYGYFDPLKCYAYSVARGRFEPQVKSEGALIGTVPVLDKDGNPVVDDAGRPVLKNIPKPGVCTGMWSGNFLNWIAMSRIDTVRKLLYGGYRSTDTATETVLERAFVTTDAHAWAKWYNPDGLDPVNQPPIEKLTPFSGVPTTTVPFRATTTTTIAIPTATTDLDVPFSSAVDSAMSIGDQICFQRAGAGRAGVCSTVSRAPGDAFFVGAVLGFSNGGQTVTVRVNDAGAVGSGADTNWTVTNLSRTGISFCNLTTGTTTSQANTSAPLIRVARGNFGLWSSNERWQCQWSEEHSNTQRAFSGIGSNGNNAALSEISASAENPSQAAQALGSGSGTGEFNVRVQVCVANADPKFNENEKCTQYPSGVSKPTGFLQLYGDNQTVHFGLMTGSYENNLNGGVLRKNVGSFNDEVRVSTNGTFTRRDGIVKTLDALRMYGYNYVNGTYLGSAGDNCDFQQTSIATGTCGSWGNPMSEVFFESVRYFVGDGVRRGISPTPAYLYRHSGSKDEALSLPAPATWRDPLSSSTFCAPLNVITFNASVSSNDDDLRRTTLSELNSDSTTIGGFTTKIGELERINGNGNYFVGKIVGSPSRNDGLCTDKSIAALGDVSGICPEGPTLQGSYLMAGVAHYAHTNRIRNDFDRLLQPTDASSLKVNSYGIQLAGSTPQLELTSSAGRKVVIQPIYRLVLPDGTTGGGALVDLKYVRLDRDSGKIYLNWEDSQQGGDYDQDMWGTLEWKFSGNTISITTNAVSASTINPQGFGYTITGTTQDGPHFHSGILGFNFSDVNLGCNNCQVSNYTPGPGEIVQKGPQTATYALGGTPAQPLKDPMWYMAKYGGFADLNGNGIPDTDPSNIGNNPEWDSINNLTPESNRPDGDPDRYFLVNNPLGLEAALRTLFGNLPQLTTASSVAANSTSLKSGAGVFSAGFNAKLGWSGTLTAQTFNTDGTVNPSPVWRAQEKVPEAGGRHIYTFNDDPARRAGAVFAWDDLSAAQQGWLNTNPDDPSLPPALGKERLAYLRGDRSLEGSGVTAFRQRDLNSGLGDIVNSSPVFVPAVPNDPIRDSGYKTFRDGFIARPRTPMLYVGANDGMLHGFDATLAATGGVELMGYVPSKIYKNLNQLTSRNYRHRYYVDATPAVGDAKVAGDWKTVLVGTLGGGGQSIYALDVTNPGTFAGDNPRSVVMWEFSDTDDIVNATPLDAANPGGLGYVLSQPVIRRMANGRWAAIVSGGYNNFEADGALPSAPDTKASAYLYILFLEGPSGPGGKWVHGTDYIRIDTGAGTAASPNGLAQPFAADVDSDGYVDFIYAGDLLGNMWKFDVSAATAGQPPGSTAIDPLTWMQPSNMVKLFAGNQPITSQAVGTLHPTGTGFIIAFGTGKYLEPGDTIGTFETQSYYGIWDKNDSPGNIVGQTTVTGTSRLFEQIITNVSAPTGVYRSVDPRSGTAPDWTTNMGWFMDFPRSSVTGERVVYDPMLVASRLVFSTLIPSGGACQFGGTSFLMVLNPVTGGRFENAVLDVNGADSTGRVNIDNSDRLSTGVFASGVQSAVGITPTPTVIGGRNIESSGSATVSADGTTNVRTSGSVQGNLIFQGSQVPNATQLPVGLSRNWGRVIWREVLKR